MRIGICLLIDAAGSSGIRAQGGDHIIEAVIEIVLSWCVSNGTATLPLTSELVRLTTLSGVARKILASSTEVAVLTDVEMGDSTLGFDCFHSHVGCGAWEDRFSSEKSISGGIWGLLELRHVAEVASLDRWAL